MRIRITESQLNKIILEKSGYVANTDALINFVYNKFIKYMTAHYDVTRYMGKPEEFRKWLQDSNLKEGNILTKLLVDKEYLTQFGVIFANSINFIVIYSDEDVASLSEDIDYDETNFKINYCEIYLPAHLFTYDRANVAMVLQHEITHAYEISQRNMKHSSNNYENFSNNNYYPDFNDFESVKKSVQTVMYYMNKMERNANISSLYTLLKQNNADRSNYKEIFQKSDAYNVLESLNYLKEHFQKNTANIIKKIYDYSQQSQYADTFPSSKGMTPQRYQKRLISAISSIIVKFEKKVKQVIDAYLMETTKEN